VIPHRLLMVISAALVVRRLIIVGYGVLAIHTTRHDPEAVTWTEIFQDGLIRAYK